MKELQVIEASRQPRRRRPNQVPPSVHWPPQVFDQVVDCLAAILVQDFRQELQRRRAEVTLPVPKDYTVLHLP